MSWDHTPLRKSQFRRKVFEKQLDVMRERYRALLEEGRKPHYDMRYHECKTAQEVAKLFLNHTDPSQYSSKVQELMDILSRGDVFEFIVFPEEWTIRKACGFLPDKMTSDEYYLFQMMHREKLIKERDILSGERYLKEKYDKWCRLNRKWNRDKYQNRITELEETMNRMENDNKQDEEELKIWTKLLSHKQVPPMHIPFSDPNDLVKLKEFCTFGYKAF